MSSIIDMPFELLVWYVGLLDSIPDYWRALIAGGLLVLVLRLAQRKVPVRHVQFSMSFTKMSLLVLVLIPLLVWGLPMTRLAVLVERLEPAPPAHLAWLGALAVWAAGFLTGGLRLAAGYARALRQARALPPLPAGHKLNARLEHWQRRLGIRRGLSLTTAGPAQPRHLAGVRRVVLPQAAGHWPLAAADLLIIQALCRYRKHQGAWHLFSQLVACAYWPVPWVAGLQRRLLQDFQIMTDSLAAACYQDDMGYRRALRQVEQRSAGQRAAATQDASYREHLLGVLGPAPGFAWDPASLTRVYDRRRELVWSEPGEKLAFLVGQAVLVAVLVGGVTLQEIPPEIERDYSITLNPKWMETAFRDPERYATQALPLGPRIVLTPQQSEQAPAAAGGGEDAD